MFPLHDTPRSTPRRMIVRAAVSLPAAMLRVGRSRRDWRVVTIALALGAALSAGCQDLVDINNPRVSPNATTQGPYVARGVPDFNFGVDYNADGILDGYVMYDGVVVGDEVGKDVVGTSAGLIYVAGYAMGATQDMALWRYTYAGALDSSFGTPNGYVTHDNAAGGSGNDSAEAVAIDSAGRIVVAGWSINNTTIRDMVVWRFLSDGTLDTLNFGAPNGYYVHTNAAVDTAGYDLAITSAGKIVVVGTSDAGANVNAAIWRLNANGTLDATFGADVNPVDLTPDGYILFDAIQTFAGTDTANAVVLDSAERILVTGESVGASTSADMTVLRVRADGSALDTTFGVDYNSDLTLDGYFAHHNAAGGAGADVGYGIALDSAGRIVVTGASVGAGANNDMALWRVLADGSALDTTFNTVGFLSRDNLSGAGTDNDVGHAVVLDGTGNILVAGSSAVLTNDAMVLWRFTAAGATDTTFGLDAFPQPTPDGISDGFLFVDSLAGGTGPDIARGLRLDSDGKILIVGESANAVANQDMVLVRVK